jgi:hypothetical protein
MLKFSPGSMVHIKEWVEPGLPGVSGTIIHLSSTKISNVDVVSIDQS